MKIAVDAMGGDNAPKITVEGAMQAISKFSDIEIVLFGDENQIRPLLTDSTRITIEHCEDYFRMDEKDLAAGVRKRKEASMIKAMKACFDKQCDAIVTAGPTGAVISGGTLIVKRIPGFSRPALGPTIPQINGEYMILLDSGANVECKPEWLLQFAQIASIYSEKVLGKKQPRIGLLNNGEEEKKGREFEKQTYDLLKDSDLNFVGNIEGKEILMNACDILVTDGFSGNIALKTIEGTAKAFGAILKKELMANFTGKLGAIIAKRNLKNIKKNFDASEVGGAVLFGCNSVVVKAHGSSDGYAYMNAIRQARKTVKENVIPKIREVLMETQEKNKN
ncbi:phosphate acyltransferase PlsX [Mycoplasmatota bacterium]|nr:phosphate acyltransferase PlsX [Mycoplasmatota bacterium]